MRMRNKYVDVLVACLLAVVFVTACFTIAAGEGKEIVYPRPYFSSPDDVNLTSTNNTWMWWEDVALSRAADTIGGTGQTADTVDVYYDISDCDSAIILYGVIEWEDTLSTDADTMDEGTPEGIYDRVDIQIFLGVGSEPGGGFFVPDTLFPITLVCDTIMSVTGGQNKRQIELGGDSLSGVWLRHAVVRYIVKSYSGVDLASWADSTMISNVSDSSRQVKLIGAMLKY